MQTIDEDAEEEQGELSDEALIESAEALFLALDKEEEES